TLGLSRFLVSGLVLVIAREWIGGFYIATYWWAVLAAVIISILTGVIEKMVGTRR
ncbi:MAG: phage holin family protein, partial [Candidatus Aegiribacteria sp.]|nr:phage holin family protein [Candidatus Aegiribacteria sp.]MBD3295257.1 phage holin family protein [Candidatus Fermentibacteria bacterium]